MAIIQGQVIDPEGRPVAEATVYFVSAPGDMPDIAQLTDREGKFTTHVRQPGKYTIGVQSDNWGVIQKEVGVVGDKPVIIEVQFDKLEGEKQ